MKALWWFAPLALVIVGAAVFSHSTGGSSAGQLTMSIDADPTNGTRPCAPIDAAATVPLNTTHTVAVCLSNYLTDFGTPNAFEARVEYSTLETAPEVADAGTALADNPDANDTAAPNGLGATGWDCTGFGLGLPKGDDPLTAERDAFITCYNSANTGVLASEPGLLATITLTSGAVAGQEALSFLSSTNIYSINCPTSVDLACVGATINIGAAGPTNTATPSATPTRTNTPTATSTSAPPTNTPTRTSTPIAPTNTPTRTSTSTATSTSVVNNTPTNTPTATSTSAVNNTPTNTPTATNTSVVNNTPTNTPTATNTSVVNNTPTNTPTATNTSVVNNTPTNTPTATNTSVVNNTPTNTPTATNTSVVNNTPTNTPVIVNTATSTPTVAKTKTVTPTRTATPAPQNCLTHSQKRFLVLGIVHHFGAHAGSRRYDAQFDVTHNGVIDWKDLIKVTLTRTCRSFDRHDIHHGR